MRARTIGELFLDAAAQHRERDAMIFRDRRWRYGELGEAVAAGRHVLQTLAGAVPRRVVLVGANHPAYVIGYFAAHTLGAGTVELGRDERLSAITSAITATAADLVLTDRDDLLACELGVPAIGFTNFLAACEAVQDATAEVAIDPVEAHAPAAIVYTSGTTGKPKGVILTHSSILFVVGAVRAYLGMSEADRYALVLPLAHTYGKSNLLSAVAAGAAVVFVEQPQDPAVFFGQIMREGCTILSVVPFHLNVLARFGVPAGIDLGRIRAITTSGGPLPEKTALRVQELLPHTALYSMYGLTESSTRVTYLPPDWLGSKAGSVGRPLPGVELEIRADDGTLLPAGQVGHVLVRGPNVMLGYYDDDQLTAETLIDGWLRTGDLGYLDEDGCLFLTAREKEIIKVAGERISPAEIEEVLLAYEGVAEAAVVGMPDPLLGETVWACVVFKSNDKPFADISAFCAARLSPHKVPRRFLEVAGIPRTPTGKIRRHILKESILT